MPKQIRGIKSSPGAKSPSVMPELCVCLLLILAIISVYAPVRHFDFINYDDPEYVTDNLPVRSGLTADGVVRALTSAGGDAAVWMPVTWLSHMLDCQIFGLDPGRHHLTSVVIHILNTLLVFLLLRRITGSRWSSAAVALLFALHPLRVESVAWVSERKDVLCAFFFLLSLLAYLRYAERPRFGRYALMAFAFVLGLMSKPMMVTLPFVLVLLDIWPLRRIPPLRWRVVWEKAPLVALSVAASVVTYIVQQRGGAVATTGTHPLLLRFGNALVSYCDYLLKIPWPAKLAVFYPFPRALAAWEVLAATLVLVAISALALRAFRRCPYVTVGWLWYLGTLVPVLGLVQVGSISRADRYTYIPMIGLSIILARGAADVMARRPNVGKFLAAISVLAVTACGAITARQLTYWSNSETLFTHALEVSEDNYVAHINLGQVYLARGRDRDAMEHSAAAARLVSNSPLARVNLATALERLGRIDDAEAQYRAALRLEPRNAEAYAGLGVVLAEKGRTTDGVAQLERAIRIKPEYADAHYNLGRLLIALGRTGDAIGRFSEAIRIRPGDAAAHYNLGTALARQGRLSEAGAALEAAVQLRPEYASAHYNLGRVLAMSGRRDEAIAHLTEALRLDPGLPGAREALDYLAASR